MGAFEIIAEVVALGTLFVALPCLILSFVRKDTAHKRVIEIEKLKYQKEILELEIKKQDRQLLLFHEENKKLDKIIYEQ